MHPQDFVDLFECEEKLWWFAGMRELSAALLDEYGTNRFENVLDIGCGTGLNLKWLECYAKDAKIKGLDIDPHALEFCRERGSKFLTRGSAAELPFADESFDLVTHFDVLVQIVGENADETAMAELFRVLKPGGIAFIRVAAYEWMYSAHDAAINTQRRYNLDKLSQKLEKAGFTILRKTYANTFLFPVAFFKRIVLARFGLSGGGSDVKPFPPSLNWLNWLLTRPLLIEAKLLKHTKQNLPFGLSAICIVRKT